MSLAFAGWTCRHCKIFNGEEKAPRSDCRSCGREKGPMNRVVFKFPIVSREIPSREVFCLRMDPNAEVLSVQQQKDALQLWALLDPEIAPVDRWFAFVPTGLLFDATGGKHVTTLLSQDGEFVIHLFEVPETQAKRIKEQASR